jgi:hypothetical protein
VSAIEELRSYARRLRDRFRLGVLARGTAVLAALALIATLLLTLITSRFAFSSPSLWSARVVLIVALALAAAFGLAIPLWRWSQRWWARRAEQAFPQFKERLLTFTERDQERRDPFLELLAADTLKVARTADVKSAVPDRVLGGLLVAGLVSLATLIWLIRAGPGYLGYGASALWTGPAAAPYFQIRVKPGNATVRRHADQLITAELPGLNSRQLSIHVRYQGATKWEAAPMQQQPAGPGYQFLFAGIPEDIEYYVGTGSIETAHFHLQVADIPAVKQIRVTYHHPEWMHQADAVEEHGGDLRAVAGTEARLEVLTDRAMSRGVLALDDGHEIPLTAGAGNVYHASIVLEKDGTYHVAARETAAGTQRISEDYFIEASPVKPPEVAVVRPDRDYRASPIEEVTLSATASDDFGLADFALRYSVNGGPEQTVKLLKEEERGTATKASGGAVLALETLKLVPGDVVGFYALAKDARSESRSDISFIQVDPFEREFSQSQQSGGAGGGMGNEQAQIAEREKEIIAATWRQAGLKNPPASQAAEQAKFLSDVQNTLRGQAEALAGRLQMRDLHLQNEQFGSFEQDMAQAAAAMRPAAQKLTGQAWSAAVSDEQKALQHLLRAEATFRQIQVAFGSAAGSGGVNSAGRDLASLFDLELDTEKNQYESAQQAATKEQRSALVDEALRKLDELARRQNALAEQRRSDRQSAEERWQQEMLRRKAEELTRQLEQLARSGAQSTSGQAQAASGSAAQQALSRLRQAQEDMRHAVDQQNAAAARQAAQRLREAMNLLGGVQRQDAGRQLDSLGREAERLAKEQREQADRMRSLQGPRAPGLRGGASPIESLIADRQKLANDLAALTRDMRAAERAALERSHGAASKLRDALNDLEQADTETQLQRSADQLRRGYAPLSDAPENEIASELEHLKGQLGEAQQAMNAAQGQPGDGALDAVERLRGRLAALDQGLRRSSGPVTAGGGNGGGPVNGAWNTGNNTFSPGRAAAPDTSPLPVDPERVFSQGMHELDQLRRAVGEDPAARRQVDELVRAMQKLDPKRFPGNPAMVDEIYARVLGGVDRLELTLRHEPAESLPGQVRSDSPAPVPAGYEASVADYFRRLSKNP